MRKAYFLKCGMGNRYQYDQFGRVCDKCHDFRAISEIMRYFPRRKTRVEIELNDLKVLGNNLRNYKVSYIFLKLFLTGHHTSVSSTEMR